MLGILWWICKLVFLVTFGIPFIALGSYMILVIGFISYNTILNIWEKIYEFMDNIRRA